MEPRLGHVYAGGQNCEDASGIFRQEAVDGASAQRIRRTLVSTSHALLHTVIQHTALIRTYIVRIIKHTIELFIAKPCYIKPK